MGGTCSARRLCEKCIQNSGKPEGKIPVERPRCRWALVNTAVNIRVP
jgi:hypothetical protein